MTLPAIVTLVEDIRAKNVLIGTPAGDSLWTAGHLRAPLMKTAPHREAWIWIREVTA